MRQVSIPKAVVEALNEIFDTHPEAVSELMDLRALKSKDRTDREQAIIDDAAGTLDQTKTIGLLDVVNAVLDKLAPGKTVNTIHGPNGFDGFVLGRDRARKTPQPEPAE
jgi:hypothetical protein